MTGERTHWRCSHRKGCNRTVLQYGEDFQYGLSDHTHPPLPGIADKHRAICKVKTLAAANVLQPVPSIVTEVLKQQDSTLPEASRPNPAYLIRNTDRMRQGFRPQEPKAHDFEVSNFQFFQLMYYFTLNSIRFYT